MDSYLLTTAKQQIRKFVDLITGIINVKMATLHTVVLGPNMTVYIGSKSSVTERSSGGSRGGSLEPPFDYKLFHNHGEF